MKMPVTVIEQFTAASKTYDEKNRQLTPITDGMFFLIRLLLGKAPARARVLCVGVGTGAEILSLAHELPHYTFVGVDPSIGMLEVCRARLQAAGIMERCELVHGYVHNVPSGENFDIALGVLVAHFVKREERVSFYQAMCNRLRVGGILINTEISFDLNSDEFPSMVENWKTVQQLMGAAPESLANLAHVLRETLSVVSPKDTEAFLRQSGIELPVRFFQAFMISGWYGIKTPKPKAAVLAF